MPDTFDLAASAHQEMLDEGFHPDFPPGVGEQLKAIQARMNAPANVSAPVGSAPVDNDARDLRKLLWSSIDNDTSRDLDQVEVAERLGDGIRILIAIADVDSAVSIGAKARVTQPIGCHGQ